MRTKTLNAITASEPQGVEIFGDPNVWQMLCKASCIEEGWMKSTKALEIPGFGCLVQVTTHQICRDGNHAIAEAIVAVPGVVIDLAGRLVSVGEIPLPEPIDTFVDMSTEGQPSLGEGISHVVKLTREGLINANKTFGPVKFGKPSERKKMRPVGKKKTPAKKGKAKAKPAKGRTAGK